MFVVFEGVEGSGKTTQLERVAEALRRRGVDPVVTREPGGTPVGEAIREIVLDPRFRVEPVTELLLIVAARSALVADVIAPALEEGRVVLSDRYDLSTFAYQGAGRALPVDELRRLNAQATGGLRADVTVVLDLSVSDGLGRKEGGEASDRIESGGRQFHERVARAYRELARSEPDIVRVDATRSAVEVYEEVAAVLADRFPETFGAGSGSDEGADPKAP